MFRKRARTSHNVFGWRDGNDDTEVAADGRRLQRKEVRRSPGRSEGKQRFTVDLATSNNLQYP